MRRFATLQLCLFALVALLDVFCMTPATALAEDAPATPVTPTPTNAFLQSLTETERVWLRAHPVIRVAQDPSWPPVEFADARGAPSGMTADYLTLLEQRLGLKLERVQGLSWQEAYARMQRWEIDMTTSVAVTEERKNFWAFSKPYMTMPIVIVTRGDVTYLADLRELEGRKVVVVEGYVSNIWIARDFPGIELVRVKTTEEALAMLQRGEVFACVENMLVVGHYLAELKITNLKIAGTTPYNNAQCMAVRKDWAPLAGILDQALNSISPAERNAIYRRWLPVRFEYGFDYSRLLPLASLLAVFLVCLAAWKWKRTSEPGDLLPGAGRLNWWQADLFAISATAATFGLRLALDGPLGAQPTLVIFTLPIMLSAYLGGLRAGLVATTISYFGASYYLLPPIYSFAVGSAVERWQQFFVALAGVLISGISEVLHRERRRAESSIRQHLRAEEAIRRSEANLAASQRMAHLGSWELDLVDVEDLTQGGLRWSDEVFRIWGREPRSIAVSYDNFLAAVHPDDRGLIGEAVSTALRDSRPYDLTHRILRPDGTERIVRELAEFQFEKGTGRPLRMIGTVLDITDQRRAEEATARALQRLNEAQRIGKIGDWEFDLGTGAITWSPQVFEILGRDPALGPPRDYDENAGMYEPASAALIAEKVAAVIASGEPKEYELVAIRPDGQRVSVNVMVLPRKDGRGKVVALSGTVQDITQQKLAEEARRESETRYCTLFERAPDGIVIIEPGGHYVDVNAAICQMLGYTREEMIGRHASTVVVPAEVPHIQAGFDEVSAGADYHREWQFRRKDGSVFSAEAVATQMPNGNVIGILRDITERKQAEEKISRLNAELEQRVIERTVQLAAANWELAAYSSTVERDLRVAEAADRIKSAFLATMSHELRTPLNSIIGFTGIVLMGKPGPLNPEQAKQLGMVRESARHLLMLINDVLDISKIEAGQMRVSAEPFDLPASIARVFGMIGPQAEKKALALAAVVAPGLGEMVSDRRRVEQILLNLLSNAVKFTDRGRVTLTAERLADFQSSPEAAPCPAVRLRVTDTGIGIQPESLALLFQPFQQIDSGLARQTEGTGLGLAISRRLATLLGGEISAASEWAQGSTFTVILPLQRPSNP